MECPLCFEPFSERERRPKLLRCGHTYCLLCLQQLRDRQDPTACPECREQSIIPDATALMDNFLVLSASLSSMENSEPSATSSSTQGSGDPSDPPMTMWCVPCAAEARAACRQSGHHLQDAGYRRRLAEQPLEELRRLEEAALLELELHEAVLEAVRGGSQRCGQRLREVRACLEGLRGPAPSDTRLQEAERLLQASQGSDQALALLRSRESFTVSSATCNSDAVPLREDMMLRLSLLSLQRRGLLRQQQQAVDGEQESQEQQPARKKRAVEEQQDQPLGAEQVQLHRDVPVEPTEAEIPAALVAENLWDVSSARPGEQVEAKAALLNCKLQVLTGLQCDRDPAWVLQLLTRQAGTLRELQLYYVTRDLLPALRRMPALRALALWNCARDVWEDPAGLRGDWRARGLRRLDLRGLPREAVRGLLRAHGRSLEELALRVGTGLAPRAGRGRAAWPRCCGDLPALLRGLPGLRRLTLLRNASHRHTEASCREQRQALESALPHCFGGISCGAC